MPKGWQADHDHGTGLFRAHVCAPCNVVAGYIETYRIGMSPEFAAYFARYGSSALGIPRTDGQFVGSLQAEGSTNSAQTPAASDPVPVQTE